MVTRAYFDDDELSFRRESSRGHGYPLSRELPPAPSPYNTAREHHLSNHETRSANGAEQENNSRPRSRIPVACGRCRKRKIRCSGDLGGGQPCTNCKGAGADNCQFLRVSSTEATMKNEPNDFNHFEPPSSAARVQCRMVPYGHHAYAQPTTPVDTYYQRSNASLSGYQYAANPKYYTMPPFEFQDDGDFAMQQSYPAAMSSDQLLSSNFPVSSVSRTWTPGPQSSKNAPMYLEQESSFSHGQLPYHSYPLRPTISPETKPSLLNGQVLSGSLPAPESGNNRVLPFPAANRQAGSYLHSSSSGLPTSQGGYQSYDGLVSTNTQSRKSVSDNASLSSSYLPYSSSSPESLASSQRAYSSHTLSQQNADIYAPSHEGLFHANESTESSYGTSSETPKRESHSSQGGPEGSMPSMTNGNLANGHAYVPYNNQSSYPAPPMNIHHAPQRRPLSTGISAA
ncbi:putative transcriptional regulatory protein [Lachnellula occidentalis]|uniref:Putative transcriptional regulatory protein n=1 Tax=Lachnellula occidentalis TaxID=215460 RepID=A0A8H8RPG4_9HELO|nr:putative transcriptional regulatory protein [Lachnellula occidentalis]